MPPRNLLSFLLIFAGLLLAYEGVWANEIQAIHLRVTATGTQAEIELAASGDYRVISLSNPDRLAVDFPDSQLAKNLSLPRAAGVVSAVRTGQPTPGTLRIVFDLSAPVIAQRPQMHTVSNHENRATRLLIEWPQPGQRAAAAAKPADTTASSAENKATHEEADRVLALLTASNAAPIASDAASLPASTPPTTPVANPPPQARALPVTTTPATTASTTPVRMNSSIRPLIIAIDAGHGGRDPGAVNRTTGTKEKDVALAIARELARQVDATPGLRAYLIRNSDVYIELPVRSQMARAAHADMFISVHANASKNNLAARGASVHLLSTRGASSQYARWLANEENAADLIGGTRPRSGDMVTNVLLSLAQSGTLKASQDAGNHVLNELRQIGRLHSRNLEYANLSVLRNADMPAMLVETGFLSNSEDERLLVSAAYQRRVASAILQGITTFFSRQPPPGTLFAARAQAEMSQIAGGSR